MLQVRSRILIVCATEAELPDFSHAKFQRLDVRTLITGVGMVATTFALTRKLIESEFDLVLNVGIAGAFLGSAEIGDVVQVTTDRLVELGAEDHDTFIPADELRLMAGSELVFTSDQIILGMSAVNGITVNRVHGNADSIQKLVAQFQPDTESMEGAAVAYVCSKFQIPWVQLRAISNLVEPRNRAKWNIPLAIENLHEAVKVYLQKLDNEQ